MRNAFQTRILAVALAVATLGICVLAGFNFSDELNTQFPTDGVVWLETQGGLRADRVPANSAGGSAGIRAGDVLEAIAPTQRVADQAPTEGLADQSHPQRFAGQAPTQGLVGQAPADGLPDRSTPQRFAVRVPSQDIAGQVPTRRLADQVRALYRIGAWNSATYTIARTMANGAKATFPVQVVLEEEDSSTAQGKRLIALVYLLIGLYVLFRRWTAPKSLHFYIFCLVSFVLYAFRATGEPGAFDRIIYWGNLAANMLQPALFLHFAISFSDDAAGEAAARMQSLRRRLLAALLYVPGLTLIGLQAWAVLRWSATGVLSHRLDQLAVGHMALYYVLAAIVFYSRYAGAQSPLERQQLKWLTRGTVIAVGPFTIYAVLYLSGAATPEWLAKIVLLALVMLPLTFSWAIVRYRLMDVDLIFKRGVTYTLLTAALVGLYFLAVGVASEFVHAHFQHAGFYGPIVAILVFGLSFDPLKRRIQAWVDRAFERKSFDYRETLIDFGRSLNSQTDLRALLDSIVERLPQTLLVTRVAVFLADDLPLVASSRPRFELAASHGLGNLQTQDLRSLDSNFFDLGFLDFDGYDSQDHIFFENPQLVMRLDGPQRRTVRSLDLNYYLPCRVASREGAGTRTVAVLGLGRTDAGDFLSSEDMEVLSSLAGYIGIAIQNAQLYTRLEQKVSEFERLKEFHENIVESIHVGIFAVDLDDRIESWNAQMEVMYARPRAEALGQPLGSIFPAEFMAHFDSVRSQQGTHTFYKVKLTLSGGETRVANIAIAPLLTRDFAVVGRIVLVDDITDRIELETQLTQAEKLSSIGLLAAGVAHEVNTPLAVISSYTQMLAKQMRPMMEQDARLAPVLDKITQQTFRASEIVNGLLNFSRTGGAEFASVDLNRLVRDTLTLLDHQFKTARVAVETELDSALPRIQGNEGKLQQVMLNLLLNARDAMHGVPAAHVSIATEQAAGRVWLIVRDCGEGIEPEHLSRIFDPFFTTKTKPRDGQHKGTGLGLAVSYGIMQEHAGKMHVESKVGVGTTFRLEFPVPGASRATVATPQQQAEPEPAASTPAVAV